MNKIAEIFDFISDEELREAILEIKESEKEGIIKEEGLIRKYAKLVSSITGKPISVDLFLSQTMLLKQAAFRWANNLHN